MLNPQEAVERRKLIEERLASQVIDIRSGIHQELRGREKPGVVGCCVKWAWPGALLSLICCWILVNIVLFKVLF